MFGDRPVSFPQQIDFLLVPGFSLFGLTSMLDPLRHANRTSERELYRWRLISEQGGLISSSDGIEIMSQHSTKNAGNVQMVIVCAGDNPEHHITSGIVSFIRLQASHGAEIGSQDTAAYIVAAAGVLDGYRTTMHWENLPVAMAAYPRVSWVQELLVVDGKRFSCSGALSGLEMMLHLIRTQHGNGLAVTVADGLIVTHERHHSDPQRASLQKRLDSRNPRLADAVQLMENNIEEPLSMSEIAVHLGISNRELERLFKHYLQQTPGTYYRTLRLNQARWMLQQTSHSVTDVAVACGFSSVAHFSRCYQRYFNVKPSHER